MSIVDEKMALRRELRERAAAGRPENQATARAVSFGEAMRRTTAALQRLGRAMGGER